MSNSVSISVPYNYLAISSAAKMLTQLAEDIKNEPVKVPEVKNEAEVAPAPLVELEAKEVFKTPLIEEVADSIGVAPEYAQTESARIPTPPAPPVADVPAPPVSQPDAPVTNTELDSAGLPWDERIHAATKTKDVNGLWKYKRGVDRDVLVPEVEAELKAMMGEPVVEETPAPPAAMATTPTPGNPAGIPPIDHSTPSATVTTFAQLVTAITSNSIPEDKVKEALDKVRVGNFALLGARADLIPAVAGHLGL